MLEFGAYMIRSEAYQIIFLMIIYLNSYTVILRFQILLFSAAVELACERECSRGEDYRLIKLNITDFSVGFPFSALYLHV